MSAQESIAAALGEHMLAPPGSSLSRWRCAFCDWEGDSFDSHLAAVAMDAARAAVEALDTYGLADLGRSFGHGWNACHAQIVDLFTPDRVPDYRAEDFTDEAVELAQSYEPEGEPSG